jgi:pyruvate/2-oxoglutarate dehydrogenase complex dihydrolipoamide acyltransferase (E2) component
VYPIHYEIPMPTLTEDMHTGVLVKWHVQVGSTVQPGTALFDMQIIGQDKLDAARSTMQITSMMEEGFLARQFATEGQAFPANFPVGLLVEDSCDIDAFCEDEYPAPCLVEWQAAPACRKRGSLRFKLKSSVVGESDAETMKVQQLQSDSKARGMQLSASAAKLLQDAGGSAYWGSPSNEPSNRR